ncbi:MAG: hypothetical protein FWH00_05315, partial [Oscillospiraceae bacterium]|nr:hypothetical protein [Oscillospiraceae bacterium]
MHEITSARHLNNIRYHPGGIFRQTADIDMMPANPANQVLDFAPIESFTGRYSAAGQDYTQHRILNLRIINPSTENVGMFAQTSGRIHGISLFGAEITAADTAANVGAIAGRLLPGGEIRFSSSYTNISVTGGGGPNVGGLAGHIESGAVLDQSFNAGFYDTRADHPSIGSVRSEGGNVGGLAGSNAGSILNSFNNARVNIASVDVDPATYVSKSPPEPSAVTSLNMSLGGIAGFNSGLVQHNYATNFVGFYSGDIRSGGIIGRSSGTASGNFYLENPHTDADTIAGVESASKDELHIKMNRDQGAFNQGGGYNDVLTANEGFNRYTNYPYPELINNRFGAWDWGWEDIETEPVSPIARLVYYELYDGGELRYSPDSFQSLALFHDRRVRNDGYCLELRVSTAGYGLQIRKGDAAADTSLYSIIMNNDGSRAAGSSLPPDWIWQPDTFNASDPLIPSAVRYVRIFIPNSNLDTQTRLRVVDSAGEQVFPQLPETIPPEGLTLDQIRYPFDPRFSPNPLQIRSPRQLRNIAAMPARSYTQALDLDFGGYSTELSLDSATGVFSPNLNHMLTEIANAAVVNAAFTGVYNGDARRIENVNITGTADSTGLFRELNASGASAGAVRNVVMVNPIINGGSDVGAIAGTNAGIIERITLINPRVTASGSNVGGIAGTNTGTVQNCSIQHAEANLALAVANHSTVITGIGNNVGGAVGLNTGGVLTDIAVVSTSGRPAVVGGANIGGIVGATSGGTADRFMYLAVAPKTATGASEQLHPFAGSGAVGEDMRYLSGTWATRPAQTYGTVNIRHYNYVSEQYSQDREDEAFSTVDMRGLEGWIPRPPGVIADSQTNEIFPYAYPQGTLPPVSRNWPIVENFTEQVVIGDVL